MTRRDVVAIGLPSSGKTTFLAALWHLLTSDEVSVRLSLANMRAEEAQHLRALVDRWLKAQEQERTLHAGNKVAAINLRSEHHSEFTLSFPDIAGEAFQEMWESREVDEKVAASLRTSGVILFVNADTIKPPGWIVDDLKQIRALGLEVEEGQPVPWHPRLAPTQVQLVDVIQSLQSPALDVGPRRLSVVLSAWDKAAGEGVSPDEYLNRHLPLLRQYLENGLAAGWTFKVFGVSAQGGTYDAVTAKEPSAEAKRIRDMNVPSHRIRVVDGEEESHDLTIPLHWLLN
jgi:hypothetical protein